MRRIVFLHAISPIVDADSINMMSYSPARTQGGDAISTVRGRAGLQRFYDRCCGRKSNQRIRKDATSKVIPIE